MLMEGIRMGHSLRCGGMGKIIKRGELLIEFGEGLLQHPAMLGAGGGLELIGETLAGEEEAFAPTILFLLGGGQMRARRLTLVKSVGLLLFDGLTFPTARHRGVTVPAYVPLL